MPLHLECPKTILSDLVSTAALAVDKRAPREILRCVRLRAEDRSLSATCTNLETTVSVSLTLPAPCSSSGVAVVLAEQLRAIVREIPADSLGLIREEEHLRVHSADGRSVFRLPLADPNDFPPAPRPPNDQEVPLVSLNPSVLEEALARTVFATSREINRYVLGGVLFRLRLDEPRMALAATDGRRLAVAYVPVIMRKPITREISAILPMSCARLLQKIAKENPEEAEVEVQFREKQVYIRVGHVSVYSAPLEGEFPAYESIIPKDYPFTAQVSPEALLEAVKLAATTVDAVSPAVFLVFQDGEFQVQAKSHERGEANITLPGAFDGPRLRVALNPSFLTDVLQAIGDVEMRINLRDASSPILFMVGEDYRHVIMPLQIED